MEYCTIIPKLQLDLDEIPNGERTILMNLGGTFGDIAPFLHLASFLHSYDCIVYVIGPK